MNDSLGDRIKAYERVSEHMLTPNSCVIIRVDGKAFHTWTKDLAKPFDDTLISAMQEATRSTAQQLQGFKLAYVQSDEATFLITDTDTQQSQGWFGYSLNKMVSISASTFTAYFNREARWWGSDAADPAMFDSRAFTVPVDDVPNVFVWRQQDWARNSLSMLARFYMGHKDLQGKNQAAVHEMLFKRGVNWAHLPDVKKNGTFVLPNGDFLSSRLDYYDIKSLIDAPGD